MSDGDLVAVVPRVASYEGAPADSAVPDPRSPSQARPERPTSSTRIERRETITRLMNAHGEAVLGFCMRLVRARALAEDLTQQVFLEAYRDIDRFEGRSSERAWLLGIACHRCIDELKRGQRRAKLIANDEQAVFDFEDPGPGPLDHVDRARITAALEGCLKRLSPEVRATVLMRFQTGRTYEELAAPLGAAAEALQLRVSRALRTLRQCMERKGWTGA